MDLFQKIINIRADAPDESSKIKKMEDVELVLRFYALKDGRYKDYANKKGRAFKDFLTDALEEANKLSPDERKKFEEEFKNIVKVVKDGLGDEPFAKFKLTDEGTYMRQSKFNSAVYDSVMIAVHDSGIKSITKQHKEQLKNMFKDEEYFSSVSGSTNNSSKVIYRIDFAMEKLA